MKLQNTTSLDMPAPQLARDFFTMEEMKEKASFKKVKKKKNKDGVRKSKMLKADDLLAMTSEAGSQEPVRQFYYFTEMHHITRFQNMIITKPCHEFKEKIKVRRRRERPEEDQSLPDGRLPQPMEVDDGEDLAGESD